MFDFCFMMYLVCTFLCFCVAQDEKYPLLRDVGLFYANLHQHKIVF
jgi:hypothetical protein